MEQALWQRLDAAKARQRTEVLPRARKRLTGACHWGGRMFHLLRPPSDAMRFGTRQHKRPILAVTTATRHHRRKKRSTEVASATGVSNIG